MVVGNKAATKNGDEHKRIMEKYNPSAHARAEKLHSTFMTP